MMRRGIIRWLGVAVIGVSACSSPNQKQVAAVEGRSITAGEFRERFRAYLDKTGTRDNVLNRRAVLNNMVNEALIMHDLRMKGWFDEPATVLRMSEIRDQALLDAYAKRVVLDTLSVPEESLRAEFRRRHTKLKARFLYHETENGARGLKRRLEHGESFESLARQVFRDPGLAAKGGSLGYVGHGEMEPAFEDTAFSLEPGRISEPTKTGIGYAIIRVDDRIVNPLLTETDFARLKDELAEAVRSRNLRPALERHAERIAGELGLNIDEDVARALAKDWRIGLDGASLDVEQQMPLPATVDPKRVLLRFRDSTWTVGDVVTRSAGLTARQERRIRTDADLVQAIRGLAVREEILRRARAKRLDTDPEVRNQVESVSLQYVLRKWREQLEKGVKERPLADSAVARRYAENREAYVVPPEVNAAEILVRTKEEAEGLLRELKSGKDFSSLARARSLRLWAAKKGGELGYVPVQAYGVHAEVFGSARPGAVLGPLFVDPYYGVFKVLGKRPARVLGLNEARSRIEQELREVQVREAVGAEVDSLRKRYAVVIDDVTLQSVVISDQVN